MHGVMPDAPPPAGSAHARDAEPWLAPAVLVATCGGLGRLRPAPGTWGSALGLAVSAGLAAAAAGLGGGPVAARVAEAMIVVSVCLVGVPVCTRAARRLGLGKDPGAIVYDEVAAMALVLLVVPPAHRTPPVMAVAFLLFRFFDVTKPPPARWCERLPAGLGIMADDWAAAAWAAAALAAVRGIGWL
jgi:phosphatidylglycerophosphatase A